MLDQENIRELVSVIAYIILYIFAESFPRTTLRTDSI